MMNLDLFIDFGYLKEDLYAYIWSFIFYIFDLEYMQSITSK